MEKNVVLGNHNIVYQILWQQVQHANGLLKKKQTATVFNNHTIWSLDIYYKVKLRYIAKRREYHRRLKNNNNKNNLKKDLI